MNRAKRRVSGGGAAPKGGAEIGFPTCKMTKTM